MQRYFGLSQDTAGNIIPSVSVTVNLSGTGTLATIYASNAYAALANPFTSDTDGTYEFYAQNGRYDIVLAKAGFTFPATNSADLLLFDPSSVVSPAQITADQNDYSPTNGFNVSIWRLTSDATRTITGIAAGYAQQRLLLLNVGSFQIVLANDSASSLIGNRILTGVGAALTIAPDQAVAVVYDLTSARWRVVAEAVGPSTTAAVQMLTRVVVNATTSNSAAETDVLNYTVAGGTLGSSAQMRMTASLFFNNTSGGNVVYSARMRYGGTQIALNTDALATGAVNEAVTLQGTVSADNATNAQDATLQYFRSNAVRTISTGTSAIDSTVNQTFRVTMQMDTASANASFTLRFLTLEWLPA